MISVEQTKVLSDMIRHQATTDVVATESIAGVNLQEMSKESPKGTEESRAAEATTDVTAEEEVCCDKPSRGRACYLWS